MAAGLSRACNMLVSSSVRSRSRSAAGNVGRNATSASNASAGSIRTTGTPTLTDEASYELADVSVAPRKATSSEISRADRLPAPSSSIAAVRLATPGFPAGSAAAPLRKTRAIRTTGTSCISTSRTSRPLASRARCTVGNESVGVGPSAGVADRSGGCASASAGTRRMASVVRRRGIDPYSLDGAAAGSTDNSTRLSDGSQVRMAAWMSVGVRIW